MRDRITSYNVCYTKLLRKIRNFIIIIYNSLIINAMISYDVLVLDRKKPEFIDPLNVDWVITEGDKLKISYNFV